MMDDQALQAALLRYSDVFIFQARSEPAMCASCRCPIDREYAHCFRCHSHELRNPQLRQVERGFMFYALSTEQSHWMMRHYKGQSASFQKQRDAFGLLGHYLYLALHHHWHCLERKGLPPFDAWTIVPSTDVSRVRSSLEHPLCSLVSLALQRCGLQIPHLELRSLPRQGADPRNVDASAFVPIPAAGQAPSHVLVVDDTWVGGGHISSLALSVEAVISARVSMLSIARYIRRDYPGSAVLIQQRSAGLLEAYRPIEHCPWTLAGLCPGSRKDTAIK